MWKEVNVSLYSKNKQSIVNTILNVFIVVIFVLLVFEIFFAANFTGIYVVGSSMDPTLTGAKEYTEGGWVVADTSGDYVYVNKHASPTYGDIVVVNKDSKTTIIKRVIAMGGDYVKLDEGKLYLKHEGSNEFKLYNESYVDPDNNTASLSKNTFPRDSYGSLDENGYYVEKGFLFILGDNRDVSEDSRADGGKSYPVSSVYGVVTSWSVNGKGFFTAIHKFFSFDLPNAFGADNRVKRSK